MTGQLQYLLPFSLRQVPKVMHSREPPIAERAETVAFIWPLNADIPQEVTVENYVAEIIEDRAAFEKVQQAIGWHVTEDQWQLLSSEIVENSMVLVTHRGDAVAVACGLRRGYNWVELAWVAVVPGHRGRGVGKVVCCAVVRQLLYSEHTKIFGSTQDERLAAIKTYLDVGFYPLYRVDKTKRWRTICSKLGRSFSPSLWGWPAES